MLKHLAGNQRVKESLRRMLEAGRVPGGLLFAGEEGVGKKLFALELAKALNCRTPLGVEACDTCPACQRIARSNFPPYSSESDNKERLVWSEHADVGMVRPYNRLIRVNQIRELEREANFRPYEGRARLFLIEDADKMRDEASNALLKTLEEPPATSHLILITSRPAALLPTIRSRCQVIRFAPLTTEEVEAHLLGRKEAKLTRAEARLLARAARGSLGRALSTDLAAYLEHRTAMLEVLEALAVSRDRARLLRASEELTDAKRKEEYEPRLGVLESLVHDVWTLSLGASRELLLHEDLTGQLSGIGARVESRRAARWLSQLEEHRRQLEVNINRKVATDALLLAMSEELSA